MHSKSLSYLTCTAGQAKELNDEKPHGFVSLNQLLRERAVTHPDQIIAGFPERCERETNEVDASEWRVLTFTFASLWSASNTLALYYVQSDLLSREIWTEESKNDNRIVGILSPSCPEFLVTVFAALRLGYGILLLAPQNNVQTISHLCHTTRATGLICHPSLMMHGRDALSIASELSSENDERIRLVELAGRSTWQDCCDAEGTQSALSPWEEKDKTALVFHTSGSAGLPKPVHQTHRVLTECMPCIPGAAAFTTTPLYHGGMSDLIRSMNSLSTLYLYSSMYPVTASNLVHAVSACTGVQAFLSVPFILKLLAESDEGFHMLQSMALVSTGGAPLPDELGDAMVNGGTNVVSRFGSSECGFLLSSERDYNTDKEWAWLRNSGAGLALLHFEPLGDGCYELVVSSNWPTRSVSNRLDGGFATGDLFHKHSSIPNAWRFAGRIDDVIVLMNGKKVSAGPIENTLKASPSIAEVLVFGASRPALGVLILPASVDASPSSIFELVRKTNKAGPSYACIVDELVVILPLGSLFPKSSKGSLLRPRAYQEYKAIIESAYQSFESGGQSTVQLRSLAGSQLAEYVRDTVASGLPDRTGLSDDSTDLFVLGVTSLQASRIRNSLQKLLDPLLSPLPYNVVFENPSVIRLVQLIENVRLGTYVGARSEREGYNLMQELVDRYGTFPKSPPNSSADDTVLLTGATGFLGAHILDKLLVKTELTAVVLVRAHDNDHAKVRVNESLKKRGIASLEERMWSERVICLAADLSDPGLGINEDMYAMLAARCKFVVHAAWAVNFLGALESFTVHLIGTRNLLDLAIALPKFEHFVFCSSTACVVNDGHTGLIMEELPKSEASSSSLGYSRSKWVAEHLCARAHNTALGGRVSIARIGQLCGDSVNGIWNETEAWPLLISTAQYTGCLPSLDQHPSWLPVDIAADILIDVTFGCRPRSHSIGIPVYHVVNTNIATSWKDILRSLAQFSVKFKTVSAAEWLQALQANISGLETGPIGSLLNLWQEVYGIQDGKANDTETKFDTSQARLASDTMKHLAPISDDLIGKMVRYWRSQNFMS